MHWRGWRVAREVASLLGLPVALIPVSSTGSLAENARIIAEWLLAHRDASLLLVSVSKGGSDLKAALARPDAAHVFSRVVGWVNPLFLAGPFIVRERREFAALIRALALATFIGGLGFLLVPAQPAFPPHSDPGLWAGLSRFADWLNLDYNMAPSLHVALSVCCVAIFSRRASRTGRGLLWLWAFAIALSTVLAHQHHLVDALTGWALGIAAARQVSPPFPQEKVTQ